MKKLILFLSIYCITTQFSNSQILFTEDFNSYPAGHLNTDYTGNTSGQGGWVTKRGTGSATVMVTPEAGRGNVATFTTNGSQTNENVTVLQKTGVINGLWNSRTAGHNILKYEYEVYVSGTFSAAGRLHSSNTNYFMMLRLITTSTYAIEALHLATNNPPTTLIKNYTAATFPYNLWHKVEVIIDYDTNTAYYHIPTLNITKKDALNSSTNTYLPHNISISGEFLKPGSIVKYDNIKLSALQSVPSYILSTEEQLAAKFNLYPNPATDLLNITSTENLSVKRTEIYDLKGKVVSAQNFDNATDIQLSISTLASGTYMLHLNTNQGKAVKKVVKK